MPSAEVLAGFLRAHGLQLNAQQQAAVGAVEGAVLLLAVPGSGKTTVLIHRIANLIRYGCASDSTEIPPDAVPEDIDFLEEQAKYPTEEGVQRADALCALRPAAPWSILAITFTNKAANELRERLTDLLGPEANDVWAMTFHSACCRILRREIERLGYDRSFTIYDTADSERVMKDLLRERGLDEKTFPPRADLPPEGPDADAGGVSGLRQLGLPPEVHRPALRVLPETAAGGERRGF